MPQIIIAKSAGFCMGVKRAVRIAEETAHKYKNIKKIYTIGPIIHNPQVVNSLQQQGIQPLPEDHFPPPDSVIIIRAHGMPKHKIKEFKNSNIIVIDATCPHVLKSQKIIDYYSKKNYFTIIVGDLDHPEIISLKSFANWHYFILSSINDISQMLHLYNQSNSLNALIISQTTFDQNLYISFCNIIKKEIPNLKIVNSICQTTSIRQQETQQLSKICDAIIVIGGKNSANTKRLFEIASRSQKPTFFIETINELNISELKNFNTIAITAGASTPQDIIFKTKSFLENFL